MHYLIAGGGEFGTRYVRKLRIARARRAYPVERITVFDSDPDCRARAVIERTPYARLEVADLRQFGELLWSRREEWIGATWVPAPVAPHLLSDWISARVEDTVGVRLAPVLPSLGGALLPFRKSLPDGRILLSHAPGLCPVSCTEPANCAITGGRRWWEMRDTIEAWSARSPRRNPSTTSRCSTASIITQRMDLPSAAYP